MDAQIYTMYVNQPHLLMNAIRSVGKYAERVVVIDNSPAQDLSLPGFPGEIVTPPVPLYCSQSYNLILKLAIQRRQDHFFIMHSDAVASEESIENALAIGESLTRCGLRWGVMYTNYDVLCLHNTSVLKDFRWDQNLPLYYTDCDFYYRLRLAGIAIIESGIPVEHVAGGSSAIKADPALKQYVESGYPAWRHYYMTKWGGERNHETLTVPFGI